MLETESSIDPLGIDAEIAALVRDRFESAEHLSIAAFDDARRLVRAFVKIGKPGVRDVVVRMVERLSNE